MTDSVLKFHLNGPARFAVHAVFCVLLAMGHIATSSAQDTDSTEIPQRSYTTKRTNTPPVIDGNLEDAEWLAVDWGTGFRQREPYDGDPPTSETAFKILYDDKNLYIGVRCYDDDPDEIVSRMSRRDGFAGDWVEINIDSYNDKRTAFSFTASVSGVKGDEFISNDGSNWDPSWNPIWNLKTQIDSLGWSCEIEIPLSQLRYDGETSQVWGIQFTRRDFRNESRSLWQYIPQNSGFWVSGFGELRGLEDIQAKRQIEIQPFVLGRLETFKKDPENPFVNGKKWSASAGIDGKIGITTDLTLDFTINPDFGQVEADPSVVNLDGFQIFFSERRPFFIENRNLFNYNITNSEAGGGFNIDNVFYSRRIGASPHSHVSGDENNGVYVDQPDFTPILGAAKVSGKTKSGLSVGILNAVTKKEYATIDDNGEQNQEAIEPLTNFFTARVTQDLNDANTVIGGILTSTNRRIEDESLEFLHKSAMTGGLDLLHRWKDRAWRVTGRFVFSRVAGTTEAISNTQLAFEHNFDRPDADHLTYDSTLTELWGHGGDVAIANYKGKFKFQTGVTWRSPGLELNDIGFMRNADEINHYYWMGYREVDPKGALLNYQINYNHWLRWDFGGNNLYRALNTNFNMQFQNRYRIGAGITYENLDVSNNWLRGGPAYNRPAGYYSWMFINTDERKAISLYAEVGKGGSVQNAVGGYSIDAGVRIQPSDAFNFSIGPSWNDFGRQDLYVTTKDYGDDERYILSEVDQQTLSFTFRINYNITPDLTIQYYGQPFISRGLYSNFNYVVDPLNKDINQRLKWYTDDQISFEDETYYIDENRDGTTDYSFDDPDFNFVQFRSNLVIRWEYIPGSELFLVWNQGNTTPTRPDERSVWTSLWEDSFTDEMHNTFLVKLTYRFVNR